MLLTYKILSLLLDYPTEALHKALSDIGQQLRREQYLDEASMKHIEDFARYASSLPLMQWQEQYVTLFDQGKGSNLYLFDHAYGSSRDRGQAMVDLKEMYHAGGFIPCSDELPDYLPLFLEFLALQPESSKAEQLLAETTPVITKMQQEMEKQQTRYVLLLNVITLLAAKGGKP